MKDRLISVLETLNYPVYLQGSLNPAEGYPASFFTFWNTSTPARSHYDNKTIDWVWEFNVNFYSNDPDLVETVLWQAAEALQENGFILTSGKGFDLPSDEITHTGRGLTVAIVERNEGIEYAE